ncbi:Diguanylate cyclase/phosphodiesterase with PAS/PAC sensor(S) OS=Ureibacillus acetophenoni OX=614649 GN=SAMN05877842_10692 PE=4 SV=1 [Ureibacillus acetophenoni]
MEYNDVNNEVMDMTILPKVVKQELYRLRKLEYALNQTSILAVSNLKGEIEYVNDLLCEVSQYDREEIIGQYHAILYSDTFKANELNEMVSTLREGHVWKGQILNKRKDGSKYWVYTIIVPIKNEHGEITQYYSISSEITKAKQFEEESNEKQ